MEEKIVTVLNEMSEYLSITQMKKLQEVIIKTFAENEAAKVDIENEDFLNMFLAAKRIEGCSERTINYYRVTVQHLLSCTEKNVRKITTEEMREYLSNYQKRNNCSNVTIDNVRRNISSFFSWLEEEDYILKSPMKRIHKIKTKKIVKNTISDEEIEKLRDNCKEKRDLAMIDLLYSTGIRVGELVNLNIDDINFEGRECIVYGKGDKERRVYFDAKTKVHLKQYLETRFDHNEALFVTLDAPHERLKISGVEIRLRNIGRTLNLERIHPHKFRRTMATRAIDKGMPIEQVQRLLGHAWRKKHRRGIAITILILTIAVFFAIEYYEVQKLIPIGCSSENLEGLKYTEVVQKLKEAGFSNVQTKEISDLTISRDAEEKLVTDIKLIFGDSFDENTKYPSNLGITVVYHTVELYNPPLTSKKAKGMNYIDVIREFENVGFTNVTTNVEYDIVTGWLTDDGEVKSVTINGKKEFDSDDKYRLDAEVVVTYHTLKKNKPK